MATLTGAFGFGVRGPVANVLTVVNRACRSAGKGLSFSGDEEYDCFAH